MCTRRVCFVLSHIKAIKELWKGWWRRDWQRWLVAAGVAVAGNDGWWRRWLAAAKATQTMWLERIAATLAVAHEWQRLRRSMAVSDSGDGRRLQTAATEGGCGRRQRMAIADGSDGRQLRMASSSGENIEERREEFGVYMLRKIIRNKTLS
nr:hypothetical protein Iba_chr01cCG3260 [Ipomoea batatas]GMD83526.1 hypothetical protein Iba_chr14aCG5950 [Ipomoea batatas]